VVEGLIKVPIIAEPNVFIAPKITSSQESYIARRQELINAAKAQEQEMARKYLPPVGVAKPHASI
jgi:hypothetical protein